MEGNSVLKLLAIKTSERVYVSSNTENDTYTSYGRYDLRAYLFDGKQPKHTYKADWFEVSSITTSVQKKQPKREIERWYELKEKHHNTGLPKVLYEKDFDEGEEYEAVYGLYERKITYEEEKYVEVEFQINVLDEVENFKITKKEFDYKNYLIDQIGVHPVFLSTKPCYLTKKDSYDIIRNYVKNHIDPKYAKVTKDYDFAFVVEKVIAHEPEEYRVNIGKRKPLYDTRFRRNRSVTVYKIAPSSRDDYPIVEEFKGENEEDLKNNIQKYLDELMEVINKPLIECPHCNGMGVIDDEVQEKLFD